jgi:hypothetical protein
MRLFNWLAKSHFVCGKRILSGLQLSGFKNEGFKFGGAQTSLFLSCRCDAPDPMVWMLGTVLNVGLNALTVRGLSRVSGNRAFVWIPIVE